MKDANVNITASWFKRASNYKGHFEFGKLLRLSWADGYCRLGVYIETEKTDYTIEDQLYDEVNLDIKTRGDLHQFLLPFGIDVKDVK